MKLLDRLSLKFRLLVLFMFFGAFPLGILAIITWTNNVSSLTHESEDHITVLREGAGNQVEQLISSIRSEVRSFADSLSTVEAIKAFSAGYESYTAEYAEKPDDTVMKEHLLNFYESKFKSNFLKANTSHELIPASNIVRSLDSNGVALQYSYISNNPHSLGSKGELHIAQDGSSYSYAHQMFHRTFLSQLKNMEYYDIFLIDNKGRIVYSVQKEIDYGTNLSTGPAKDSGLTKVYNQAKNLSENDLPAIVDLMPYYPSNNSASSFVAFPVRENGQILGVLAIQLPINRLNKITTNDKNWTQGGFGETGQAYIIGRDRLLRSDYRDFFEHQDKYFEDLTTFGYTEDHITKIKGHQSNALIQKADHEAAEGVLRGETGFSIYSDFKGEKIHASYRPLKIPGLDWYIITEMTEAEAFSSLSLLAKTSTAVGVLCLILIFIFSWFFASGLNKRIFKIVQELKGTAEATDKNSANLKSASEAVSSATTEQASAIQETVATLNQISAMVNKSLDYAKHSAEKAENSHSISLDGKSVVDEMIRAMEDINNSNEFIMNQINDSNDQIAGIVKVINEISEKTNVINDIVFQTKLLSFNASVEAARAGEHGKGFAVVAEEVGNLAQMSGEAAKEIADMISVSIEKVESVVKNTNDNVGNLVASGKEKVESGVQIAQRCGEILDMVVDNVGEVTKMMGEVTSGAQEQAEGVSNITTAMNEIDDSTNSNANSAHETYRYSEELAEQAKNLNQIVSKLTAEVLGLKELAHSPSLTSPKDVAELSFDLAQDDDIQETRHNVPVKEISKVTEYPSEKVADVIKMSEAKQEKPMNFEVKETLENDVSIETTKITASGETADGIPSVSDPRFEDI